MRSFGHAVILHCDGAPKIGFQVCSSEHEHGSLFRDERGVATNL